MGVMPDPYTWTKGTDVIFAEVWFSYSESLETVVSRLLSQRWKTCKRFTTVMGYHGTRSQSFSPYFSTIPGVTKG